MLAHTSSYHELHVIAKPLSVHRATKMPSRLKQEQSVLYRVQHDYLMSLHFTFEYLMKVVSQPTEHRYSVFDFDTISLTINLSI